MRSMSISCPKCKVRLSVPEQFRGQRVRCSGCGSTIQATPLLRMPAPAKSRLR